MAAFSVLGMSSALFLLNPSSSGNLLHCDDVHTIMGRDFRAPSTWWAVNTVSITLVLILVIPTVLMSDQYFSRVPARGIYVVIRTGTTPAAQVAPRLVVRIDARRTATDKGYRVWMIGAAYVGEERVAQSDLGQTVRVELAKRAQNAVYLSADGELSWNDVVSVMDQIRAATNCQIVLTGLKYDIAAKAHRLTE